MKIERESAEHVAWDPGQSQGGDVVHLGGGVQRKKTLHGNLILPDAKSLRDTLGKILEDLG